MRCMHPRSISCNLTSPWAGLDGQEFDRASIGSGPLRSTLRVSLHSARGKQCACSHSCPCAHETHSKRMHHVRQHTCTCARACAHTRYTHQPPPHTHRPADFGTHGHRITRRWRSLVERAVAGSAPAHRSSINTLAYCTHAHARIHSSMHELPINCRDPGASPSCWPMTRQLHPLRPQL